MHMGGALSTAVGVADGRNPPRQYAWSERKHTTDTHAHRHANCLTFSCVLLARFQILTVLHFLTPLLPISVVR